MGIKKHNYYTADDIRKMLNISNSTLYYWIQKGHFPLQIKLGVRKAVWPKNIIDEWIKEKGIYAPEAPNFDETSFKLGFEDSVKHVKNILYKNRENIGDVLINYLIDLIDGKNKDEV